LFYLKIDGCIRHQENFVNKGEIKLSKYKIKELSDLMVKTLFRQYQHIVEKHSVVL